MDPKKKEIARRKVRAGRVVRNTNDIMAAYAATKGKAISKKAGAEISAGTAAVRREIAHAKLVRKVMGRSPLTKGVLKAHGKAAARVASVTNKEYDIITKRNPLTKGVRKAKGEDKYRLNTKVVESGNPFKATPEGKSRIAIIPSGVKNHTPGIRYKDKAGKISAITGSKTGKTYVRRQVMGPVGYLPIAALFLQHLTGKDKKNG